MLRHLAPVTALLLLASPLARAEIPDGTIKIGILQDLPDPYASETGNGAFVAAQMAAADFEKKYLRGDAEILPGMVTGGLQDDIKQVQDWLDKDDIAAVVSSSGGVVNQKIAALLEQHHRTLLVAEAVGAGTDHLCSPSTIVWGAGESARMRALAQMFSQQGKNRWYFVGEQNPAGLASQEALHTAVAGVHGQIVGESENVVGAMDLSQVIAAIDKTNADVTVLAESDSDLISVLRDLVLNHPSHPMSIAAPYAQIVDIDEASPPVAEGLVVVAPFYWNTNDQTRQFSKEWSGHMLGRHVTQNAAEVYAATASFLNAAKAANDVDAAKVGAELRRTPIKDSLMGPATVRADGRVVYDLNVYRVKSPAQISERWAYYDKIYTMPGDQAFPPAACAAAGKTADADR